MTPLRRDPHFTFRFGDDRLIPRFHLDGVAAGTRVTVFVLDPDTGDRREVLVKATAGDGGWVDLTEPLVVRAGGGFVAVPPSGDDSHGSSRRPRRRPSRQPESSQRRQTTRPARSGRWRTDA